MDENENQNKLKINEIYKVGINSEAFLFFFFSLFIYRTPALPLDYFQTQTILSDLVRRAKRKTVENTSFAFIAKLFLLAPIDNPFRFYTIACFRSSHLISSHLRFWEQQEQKKNDVINFDWTRLNCISDNLYVYVVNFPVNSIQYRKMKHQLPFSKMSGICRIRTYYINIQHIPATLTRTPARTHACTYAGTKNRAIEILSVPLDLAFIGEAHEWNDNTLQRK